MNQNNYFEQQSTHENKVFFLLNYFQLRLKTFILIDLIVKCFINTFHSVSPILKGKNI
jgi:hypothetical protein